MKDTYVHLRHLAGEIEVGTSNRIVCPFCGGGTSRETSFSLSRTSEAECLYHCFRASCGKAGRLACPGFRLPRIIRSDTEDRNTKSSPSRPVYNAELHGLGEWWVSNLYTVYGINPKETAWAGWSEEADSGSLVCPILDPHSIRRGVMVKPQLARVGSTNAPKLYPSNDSPRQAWFRRPEVQPVPVVVVEDVISALKVSRWFQSVALLGTHLNQEKLDEMLQISKVVVLALDNDATEKAYTFQKKFGLYGEIKVAVLEKDLKFESDERIKLIINSAR